MRSLILDRSYLQAAPATRVANLCGEFRVIMSESLFFEVLTADTEVRRTLFAKFPQRENPVTLVGHVGSLIRHEITNRHPASPVEELSLTTRFVFNAGLATGQFQLTQPHQQGIADWEQHQLESQHSFLARYKVAHSWFPEVNTYRPGNDDAAIRVARDRVAKDHSFVASIYDQIKGRDFPRMVEIGPAWALFRWLQVQLLYTLEYIRRYGPGNDKVVSRRVANDVIDSQYVTTALLADGLATNDVPLSQIYLCLKPHGQLLRPDRLPDLQ